MKIALTPAQVADRDRFHTFAQEAIAPYAEQFDQDECVPDDLIHQMGQQGFLGAILPPEYEGTASDMITFGLLNEQIGRACSSMRSLITVHSMASHAIYRWGRQHQKDQWLPQLATGQKIGAFALSEPNVGSDASNVETTATKTEDGGFVINGCKKWTTFGQIADLYLTFAKCDGKAVALLVERDRPGLTIKPIHGVLGTTASMVAELHFNDCYVPKANLVGGMGFGFAAVAMSCLDVGRYSVAWGCVGIGQACLDASLSYADQRQQFGQPLKEHQLIQQIITNMVTNVQAARLLCYRAGYLRDIQDPTATAETLVAKYFASTMAPKAASDAVQLHGGNGCSRDYPVQRYFRDAKIMEIIEGSHQMQQILIAQNAFSQLQS